jgi:adhesin transport system outer membrane protein
MLVLSGCMSPGTGQTDAEGQGLVAATRQAFGFLAPGDTGPADPDAAALDPELTDGSQSEIIAALLDRRSVLGAGPLREVAEAVLAANARTAEAELRAATLRSEAAERNWLPRVGPTVSLTSLGDIASSMLLDAVLFDHGARTAGREYARADVEVAAVALAEDTNARVLAALELYIEAEAARGRVAVTEGALEQMRRFDFVMQERVVAGISDRADLSYVGQKLSRMRADLEADREIARTAIAELQAMAARPVEGVSGLSSVAQAPRGTESLKVTKARAEAVRATAEARLTRAQQLPGITAGSRITGSGMDSGVTAGGEGGLGLGTRATLRAIEAAEEAAQREVALAREDAARRQGQLSSRMTAADRRADEAARLAREAAETWRLTREQFDAGRRGVSETVGVFEAVVRAEREAVTLAHEAVALRARLAADAGVLVDGENL